MIYKESENFHGNENRDLLKLPFETLPEIKQLEQSEKGFKQLFAAKKDGLLKNLIEEVVKSKYGLEDFDKKLL